MFRPGNLGHLGRLGLVAASQPSLVAQALAILAKYGSAANLYLPGVGAISGITAGNWLNSAGTTAATVDNPVGLVVSAGKAVGPELVTNGDFSAGSAGWSVPAGWSIASGVCTATSTNASFKQLATPCTAGKFYLVEFDCNHAGGTLYVRVGTGTAATFTTSGRKTAVLLAAGIQGFEAYGGSVSGVLDNISIRELLGAHLTQSTAANRPILRRGLVNQLTQSDFQNGVTDAPTRGGLVTASTLTGYGGALAFGHDGSATSYGYKLFAATLNAAYTLAIVVKMDDGNAPVFGNVGTQDASNPFAIVMYGNAYSPTGAGGYTVTALADNTYLVTCSTVATTAVSTNFGVVKYPTNNNRTFKVTRYGLFEGVVTAPQILASGGIPVTTTSPASSTNGPFAWQFDGSNDSFASTMTTGNEGLVCAGVKFSDANTTFFSSGTTAANAGVWLYRNAGGAKSMNMAVANGSAIAYSPDITPPANTPVVVSGGWTATTVFAGVNNTETNTTTRSGTSASTLPLRIGLATDASYALNGSMSAAIIMPTVLPTASERATLRQFIAALSGMTM